MFDLIDNLRKKPAHVRKQIAVVFSSAVSFVVFSMWIGSWSAQNELTPSQTFGAKPPGEVIINSMRGIKDEGITRWEDTMKQLKEATPVDQVAGVGATLEENITLEASAEGDGMVEEEDAGTAGGELTN